MLSVLKTLNLSAGQARLLTLQWMFNGPYHVTTHNISLFPDVKNTDFIQYLAYIFVQMKISEARNVLMFWMWRHHGKTFWRHRSLAWQNALFLKTAGKVNSWADVINDFTQSRLDCGKNMKRKISSTGSRGFYHWLELPNHGTNFWRSSSKLYYCVFKNSNPALGCNRVLACKNKCGCYG